MKINNAKGTVVTVDTLSQLLCGFSSHTLKFDNDNYAKPDFMIINDRVYKKFMSDRGYTHETNHIKTKFNRFASDSNIQLITKSWLLDPDIEVDVSYDTFTRIISESQKELPKTLKETIVIHFNMVNSKGQTVMAIAAFVNSEGIKNINVYKVGKTLARLCILDGVDIDRLGDSFMADNVDEHDVFDIRFNGRKKYIRCTSCKNCPLYQSKDNIKYFGKDDAGRKVSYCKVCTTSKLDCPKINNTISESFFNGPDRVDNLVKLVHYVTWLYTHKRSTITKKTKANSSRKQSTPHYEEDGVTVKPVYQNIKNMEKEFLVPRIRYISSKNGGHHASPMPHVRKGHWRHLKSGKKVWVNECNVGEVDIRNNHKRYTL